MAGLLQTLAKQLFGSRKTASKNVSRPAGRTSTVDFSGAKVQKETADEKIVVDRTIQRERTQEEVAREDFLLNQIDEFREKAQKLQDLLLFKESKVEELQTIVDEKEGKAKELQVILDERQKQANVITEEMNQQIDKLIAQVTEKMSEIQASMSEDLADGRKLSEEQAAQMKEALESLNTQLETIRAELSEKIHSENVKCYRNVADLVNCLEDKVDTITEVERKLSSVHKCTIAVIIFAVINMLGLAALILNELGIIDMLIN